MEAKDKPVLKFHSREWMENLAFMVDVTEHLNTLNKQLQGCNEIVTQFYDNIVAFKLKLSILKTKLPNDDAAHFPCLKYLCLIQGIIDI